MKTERYAEKPFIRLAECYVLKAIGELPAENEAQLVAMEPQLREIYHHNGSWMHIVGSALNFPNTMPSTIAEVWRRNQEVARSNGVTLPPQQFAEMFVDQNFV